MKGREARRLIIPIQLFKHFLVVFQLNPTTYGFKMN